MNIKLFYNNSRDKFMTAIEIQENTYLCSYDAVGYLGKSFEGKLLVSLGWEEIGYYEAY